MTEITVYPHERMAIKQTFCSKLKKKPGDPNQRVTTCFYLKKLNAIKSVLETVHFPNNINKQK